MTIGMIQPASIGDVIICLPIAKQQALLGHRVLWPVTALAFTHMSKGHIPYVEFLLLDRVNRQGAMDVVRRWDSSASFIDTYFGWPDHPEATQKWLATDNTFDRQKYLMAETDFSKKFTLDIARNKEREQALEKRFQDKLSKDYICIHQVGSSGGINLSSKFKGCNVIEISPLTDCIFDWIGIIEKAKELHMIDSCFVNLASQLFPNKGGVRYWKPGYPDARYYPILNPNWTTEK